MYVTITNSWRSYEDYWYWPIINQKFLFWTQMFEQHKKYQHVGKCYDQQNLKDIIDAAMVLTTEGVTDEIPNVPMTSAPVKKPSSRT